MNKDVKLLKKRFNIKVLKLVFSTLFVMIIVLTLLISSHNHYEKIAIESQQENILNIITTASTQLEEYFNTRDRYLKAIINDPQFLSEFKELKDRRIENVKLIDLLFNMSPEEYMAIELIDSHGDILRTYTNNPNYEYLAGEDIIRAVNTHNDIYFVQTLGDRSINIIHSIKENDELYGFVRMKFDTEYIYSVYLEKYQLYEKGYISLKDNKGRLFIHPSEENIGQDVLEVRRREYPDYDWSELEYLVQKQVNKETGVGIYHSIWPKDRTRVKKINSYTPCRIGDTFIILNFSLDYKEVMFAFESVTNATIFISVILIGLSLMIISYIYMVEVKKNNIALESMYFDKLKEKNAIIMHQSKYASMGEMLATIAHQLKQPLNALKLSLYNIEDYHNFNESDEVYLENLLQSNHRFVDKISKTIDDFKYFFKPQSIDEDFNVYDAIKFAIELNMSRIDELEILVTVLGDKTAKIKGQSNVFSQVALNLINNSIDALNEIDCSRKISINISKKENQVVVELLDNGGGISVEVMERLFEPYVTTKGEQGTGLGLYICKYILNEKFNGELIIGNILDGTKVIMILPEV